ncbi:hypothetical protein L1049_019434 [Liquidambar formosana]|uniref:Poly(A) RNA polymerase mitochondrial-like central palm domain-containing protein n=1 Tax=Liquidambar formosana TaxID=63359 RepID=A0AAP0S5R6_LIQFO
MQAASADKASIHVNKGLRKKAKELELKGLQKNKLTQACKSELEELLHDVCVIRRPKPSDYYHRRELVRVFNAMAKEIYGSCDFPVVEEFGSFVMDIFSAESDLDMSVNFSDNAVAFPREKKIQTLQKFAKKLYTLQRRGYVSSVQRIMSARVPIVKVIDCGTKIECDISVENRDGITKSRIIHMISAIDDRFQKLSFLMKAWAKEHDINSSKDRTLNSLSIISLVAFHLQTRDPPILPPFSAIFKDGTDPATVMKTVHNYLNYGKRNKESLAELFVTLLVKLASVETLWPNGLCASTYEGAWIFKFWDSQVGCISVEDFTLRSENLARAVGKAEVSKIYNCIHRSLCYLMAFKDSQIHRPKIMELLFGLDPIPNFKDYCTTYPDRNAANPSIRHEQPIQKKKARLMEGWGAIQESCSGSLSNLTALVAPRIPYQTLPVVSSLGHGVSCGPLKLPFVPTQNPTGFVGSHDPLLQPPSVVLPNPLGVDGLRSLNPLLPMPYVAQMHAHNAQTNHNQNRGHIPAFYLRKTG